MCAPLEKVEGELGNTSPIHLGTLREDLHRLFKLAYGVALELKRRRS